MAAYATDIQSSNSKFTLQYMIKLTTILLYLIKIKIDQNDKVIYKSYINGGIFTNKFNYDIIIYNIM